MLLITGAALSALNIAAIAAGRVEPKWCFAFFPATFTVHSALESAHGYVGVILFILLGCFGYLIAAGAVLFAWDRTRKKTRVFRALVSLNLVMCVAITLAFFCFVYRLSARSSHRSQDDALVTLLEAAACEYVEHHGSLPQKEGNRTWVYLLCCNPDDPYAPWADIRPPYRLRPRSTAPVTDESTDLEIIDSWGNPVAYSRDGEEILIYTFGPNEIDEGGRGDDVSRLNPPATDRWWSSFGLLGFLVVGFAVIAIACGIRGMLDTDSGRRWTPIPAWSQTRYP